MLNRVVLPFNDKNCIQAKIEQIRNKQRNKHITENNDIQDKFLLYCVRIDFYTLNRKLDEIRVVF